MGYAAYGTDLEPRMIDYTEKPAWLSEQYPLIITETVRLERGDATTHRWRSLPDTVAGETYLGRPFTTIPSREILEQTASEVNTILKSPVNIRWPARTRHPPRLAVLAWQISPGRFRHLPLIDSWPISAIIGGI